MVRLSSREATSGYRYDNLPAGTYVVELDVTEWRATLAPGRRVFDVWVNGARVLKETAHTGATPGQFVRGPGAA